MSSNINQNLTTKKTVSNVYKLEANLGKVILAKQFLESFCCQKSPNQEISLRRFSEYRTSEGSECYQIDPR